MWSVGLTTVEVCSGLGAGVRHLGMTLALFQETDNEHQLTLFVGVAAFSLLALVLMACAVGLGAFIALKKVSAEADDIKGKVMPLVAKVEALVEQVKTITTDLTPTVKNITVKAETIAGHAEEISGMVKEKVVEFGPTVTRANETLLSANQTVMDATSKTHEQLLRVNEMITETLDATERAGKRMVHNVTQPGREIAGVAAGVKAAVQTFLNGKGRARSTAPGEHVRTDTVPQYPVATVADALARDKSNDIGL